MLLAMVFRGVAFEFRFEHQWLTRLWAKGFCAGSAVATFAQGALLGAFIQGFTVQDRSFAGSSWDWLTPFSVLTGLALMAGYGLLGAGWLVIKTEGALQAWARRAGRVCLICVLAAILAISIWTPLLHPAIAARWFGWPNLLLLAPVPIVTAVLAAAAWRALGGWGSDAASFLAAMGLFLMSYLGIAISLWPMIVPQHFTLWQAASAPGTQAFLLIGTMGLLPVILMYTAWSYWVFRGKITRRDRISLNTMLRASAPIGSHPNGRPGSRKATKCSAQSIRIFFTAAYAEFAIAPAAMLVKRGPLPLEGAHAMMRPQCALAGAHNRNPTEAGDEEPRPTCNL